MTKLSPDDPNDCIVIRAAAKRILCDSDATADEVEVKAQKLAAMIAKGDIALAINEGLTADAEQGFWLVANFKNGTQTE
jgi:hypothetical protein